jgi:sialate O-acetylesterase
MIAPLVPYGIRGALWYQGESNNGEGMLYAEKMKALINGWRKLWNDETMPFNFVQIAPYRYNSTGLPFLWEAQLAASKIPGVGMALTMDISDIKDIHPKNKQEVGRRLALIALTRTYGVEGLVHGGPVYKSMRTEGGKARISFDGVAGGLKSRDGKELNHFTVAGADKKFVPAKAVIEGNEVVVSADGVSEITAVRFGWHELAEPNLANKEGLPAYPFRTDSWK